MGSAWSCGPQRACSCRRGSTPPPRIRYADQPAVYKVDSSTTDSSAPTAPVQSPDGQGRTTSITLFGTDLHDDPLRCHPVTMAPERVLEPTDELVLEEVSGGWNKRQGIIMMDDMMDFLPCDGIETDDKLRGELDAPPKPGKSTETGAVAAQTDDDDDAILPDPRAP